MDLQTIRDLVQIAASTAVATTGIIALVNYRRATRREQEQRQQEQKQREEKTYTTLDEKYLDFERLCLQHSELDVFDVPQPNPRPLNEEEKRRELIIFTILFTLFERAFLAYQGHTEELRKKQWDGWVVWVQQYCCRQNFYEAWKISGSTFDEEYQKFMTEEIESARSHLPAKTAD